MEWGEGDRWWQGPSCKAVEARVRLREVVLRMDDWVFLPGLGTRKALKFVDGMTQAPRPQD